MFISISHFEEAGADLEEGLRHVREEVVPSIEGVEGLVAAYWAVDPGGTKRVSILVWEHADSATTAMPAVVEAIRARREAAGIMPPQASPTATERFEVIAHV